MSERSERIISTGFGEASYAEPLTGAPIVAKTQVLRASRAVHQ